MEHFLFCQRSSFFSKMATFLAAIAALYVTMSVSWSVCLVVFLLHENPNILGDIGAHAKFQNRRKVCGTGEQEEERKE